MKQAAVAVQLQQQRPCALTAQLKAHMPQTNQLR